ncbi:MAG: hypothetical protein HY822_18635 [Acidobacteria bacterium]|nr:hypothetical protein [Acidobacteriota bacterium]
MIRKTRIGQLQAVGVSGVGLSHIEPGVGALAIPMLVDSYGDNGATWAGCISLASYRFACPTICAS